MPLQERRQRSAALTVVRRGQACVVSSSSVIQPPFHWLARPMRSRFFVTAPPYVTEQELIDALQGCHDCSFLSARSLYGLIILVELTRATRTGWPVLRMNRQCP